MTGRFANLWKEQFSFAHLQALAAQAGCSVDRVTVDVYGIDCLLTRPGVNSHGVADPQLGVQLKATASLNRDRDELPRFPLPVGNYDALRGRRLIPAVLIVLEVPRSPNEWVVCSDNEICLRHRAYWRDLRGEPEMKNQSSVTVEVPNILDKDTLVRILDRMDHNGLWA